MLSAVESCLVAASPSIYKSDEIKVIINIVYIRHIKIFFCDGSLIQKI